MSYLINRFGAALVLVYTYVDTSYLFFERTKLTQLGFSFTISKTDCVMCTRDVLTVESTFLIKYVLPFELHVSIGTAGPQLLKKKKKRSKLLRVCRINNKGVCRRCRCPEPFRHLNTLLKYSSIEFRHLTPQRIYYHVLIMCGFESLRRFPANTSQLFSFENIYFIMPLMEMREMAKERYRNLIIPLRIAIYPTYCSSFPVGTYICMCSFQFAAYIIKSLTKRSLKLLLVTTVQFPLNVTL